METPAAQSKLLRPLFTAFIFYSIAGIFKISVIISRSHGFNLPQLIGIGEKAFIFFFTLGTVILIRWLIADAPFNMLRRYTIAPLLKSIISLLLYFVAVIFLLHRLFGINLTPLLTTSAVLTGILALSLQETLKNFFTGLWINTERIVAKGDWVRIADREGQIIEVTWNTTRLLTRENDLICLPNRLMMEKLIENYTYPTPLHTVEVDIGASYYDPPNKVKNILIEIAKNLSSGLAGSEPEVWITHYTDFSMNYRLRVWVNSFKLVPYVKSEIYNKIWYAFRRNNIEIPFPVRVTYEKTERRFSETEIIMDSLKKIEFLSPLNYDELRSIALYSSFETFGAGEKIIRQGDRGDTFYLIQGGGVDVFFRDSTGSEKLIDTLKAGDFFGEMSLLAGERRSATVIAREDTSCIIVTSKGFQDIFIKNPDLAEILSKLLVKRSGKIKEMKDMAVSEKVEYESAAQKNIMKKIKHFFRVGLNS